MVAFQLCYRVMNCASFVVCGAEVADTADNNPIALLLTFRH